MPIVHTIPDHLSPTNRPTWSTITSAGIFRVTRAAGWFDNHFHDCDEYWLVFRGKAKVRSEGIEFYVMPGDIVATRAGDEHDVLEVYEDLEAYWIESLLPAGGRTGHLYRPDSDPQGHPVLACRVPADFPTP